MLLQWAHCSPHLRHGQYFNECFLLQSGQNWLGCHFQQTLPWPNDPNWHGQYFQGRFLYKLDHVSISYHHFHYWFGHMIIPIIGWFCSWSLLFWGLKFHSSFSSFILLFRALAWSHFLDYWSSVLFSTFHSNTLSNIFMNVSS